MSINHHLIVLYIHYLHPLLFVTIQTMTVTSQLYGKGDILRERWRDCEMRGCQQMKMVKLIRRKSANIFIKISNLIATNFSK